MMPFSVSFPLPPSALRPCLVAARAAHLARAALTASLLAGVAAPTWAGDRVLGTWGVTQIEGAAGGGLTPWALIAGGGSRDQTGASVDVTRTHTRGGYDLRIESVALGLADTVELSLAHWRFGLSDTVPGQAIRMDIVGAKWRVWGDALQDQDAWWPQVAIGAQAKQNRDMAVPTALGARHDNDVDGYVTATKLWLAGLVGRNVLANATLRATRANQFGLLGFGGDRRDARRLEPEASLALLPRDDLAVGVEYRAKPNNLSVFREQRAADAFIAWFPSRHLSVTAAAVDLGNIANKPAQRGWYVAVQAAL